MFLAGKKLIEIAEALSVPEGTVRSWKNRYKWDTTTLQKKKDNVAKEKNKGEKVVVDEVKEIIENPNLTDKQRLFCIYYIRCFNATKAYQKAYGVNYATAMVEGCKILRNPKIREQILVLKQERFNREFLSEADIFQKYMDIAFADITDYVEFGCETVPVMGPFGPIVMKDKKTGEEQELKKEINVVRFKKWSEVDGTLITEIKQGKDGASIKLADRMKALQWLANHMDLATEEQKIKIAILKNQMDSDKEVPIQITFQKASEKKVGESNGT